MKTSQQLADELAYTASTELQVGIYEMPVLSNEDHKKSITIILEHIPLLELLEVARAARVLLKQLDFDAKSPKQIALLDALTNLQKKVEL